VRWYLEGTAPPAVPTWSPRRLRGQPLEPDFATMLGLGSLKRVMTEAQMVLHDCAANEQRVAAGKPPVNSVWPWGGGTPRAAATAPPAAVVSDDDLALACARFAGTATAADVAALLQARPASAAALAVICAPGGTLAEPARFLDAVLGPALAALARGTLAAVSVDGGAWRLRFTPRTHWRRWRSARGFLDALRTRAGAGA
jgi:hypothetical protein